MRRCIMGCVVFVGLITCNRAEQIEKYPVYVRVEATNDTIIETEWSWGVGSVICHWKCKKEDMGIVKHALTLKPYEDYIRYDSNLHKRYLKGMSRVIFLDSRSIKDSQF